LRDLADFIDAHPELPELRATAWVDQYLRPHRDARKELTAVANALGKAFAKEERHGSEVEISGKFGAVRLRAVAKVSELRDEPEPELDYEPIIGGRVMTTSLNMPPPPPPVVEEVNGLGWPVVEDSRSAVRCAMCETRVQAQVETNAPASTHYVLPVDSEGRCTSCVLLLCEGCGGREGGCGRCDWTGITGTGR
jgi:hypothetical protein